MMVYQTQTVQAIVKTYEDLDQQSFSDIFEVLTTAFSGNKNGLTDLFIRGMSLLCQGRSNHIDKTYLTKMLKRKRVEHWRREAEKIGLKLGGSGFRRYESMEIVLVRAYNRTKGIPTKLTP